MINEHGGPNRPRATQRLATLAVGAVFAVAAAACSSGGNKIPIPNAGTVQQLLNAWDAADCQNNPAAVAQVMTPSGAARPAIRQQLGTCVHTNVLGWDGGTFGGPTGALGRTAVIRTDNPSVTRFWSIHLTWNGTKWLLDASGAFGPLVDYCGGPLGSSYPLPAGCTVGDRVSQPSQGE